MEKRQVFIESESLMLGHIQIIKKYIASQSILDFFNLLWVGSINVLKMKLCDICFILDYIFRWFRLQKKIVSLQSVSSWSWFLHS